MPENYFVTWTRQFEPPVMEIAGAEHDEFILKDGRRIYDFVSTSFQASFGHNHELIRQRIHSQLDAMPITSPKAIFDLKQTVTNQLLELLARDSAEPMPGRIFYTVSGAESVENALKIARHFSGKNIILARHRSYHGATLGAMSVSGDWRSHDHLNFSQGTVRIPEPDTDPQGQRTRQIVEQVGPEQIAAIIVETITGVNGVIIPPQSWWTALGEICREFDILLIVDEVLVGFGRTGKPFAFQHFDVRPDFVCLSKGITGGYIPFGAVWARDRIAQRYDDQVLACGLTNYAHPLGLAAMGAVIELLGQPDFRRQTRQLESDFENQLEKLKQRPDVQDVRYKGLLAAIDFTVRLPDWESFLNEGLYLVSREQMLVLAPPFVSTPPRLNQAFDALTVTLDHARATAGS